LARSIEQFYADQATRRAESAARVALLLWLLGFAPVASLIAGVSRQRSPIGEVQGGLLAMDAILTACVLFGCSAVGFALAAYARRLAATTSVRIALGLNGLSLAIALAALAAVILTAAG
jgi:hypothetical protein